MFMGRPFFILSQSLPNLYHHFKDALRCFAMIDLSMQFKLQRNRLHMKE